VQSLSEYTPTFTAFTFTLPLLGIRWDDMSKVGAKTPATTTVAATAKIIAAGIFCKDIFHPHPFNHI
jgi:hypothetical protein